MMRPTFEDRIQLLRECLAQLVRAGAEVKGLMENVLKTSEDLIAENHELQEQNCKLLAENKGLAEDNVRMYADTLRMRNAAKAEAEFREAHE